MNCQVENPTLATEYDDPYFEVFPLLISTVDSILLW